MKERVVCATVFGATLSVLTAVNPGLGAADAPRRAPVQGRMLSLGAVVQLGLSRATDLMRAAQEGHRETGAEAGLRAQSAFVMVEASFDRYLHATPPQLPNDARVAYAEAQRITELLADGSDDSLVAAVARSQALARTLPLRGRYPELRTYAPLVWTRQSAAHRLRLVGRFPGARSLRARPILWFNGRRFAASEFTEETIVFVLPDGAAPAGDSRSSHPAQLTVPWDSGRWYRIWRWRAVSEARYSMDLTIE